MIYSRQMDENHPEPEWKKIEMPMKNFCNGNENRKMKVVCLDNTNDGNGNELIGEFEYTVQQMDKYKRMFDLENPKNEVQQYWELRGYIVQSVLATIPKHVQSTVETGFSRETIH